MLKRWTAEDDQHVQAEIKKPFAPKLDRESHASMRARRATHAEIVAVHGTLLAPDEINYYFGDKEGI